MASYEEAGQRGGAVQIGWDKSITGANVERAVAKIRRDHPGKKIVVGSGGHGSEGQYYKLSSDLDTNPSNYRENAGKGQTFYADDCKALQPLGVHVLDLFANDEHKRRWRQITRDPGYVMVFGWCHSVDNRRFAGAGGGQFSAGTLVHYHHPGGGWKDATVLACSGDVYTLDVKVSGDRSQRGPKPRVRYDGRNLRRR